MGLVNLLIKVIFVIVFICLPLIFLIISWINIGAGRKYSEFPLECNNFPTDEVTGFGNDKTKGCTRVSIVNNARSIEIF
jgi:hypothetical protein